jgi:hypothetical protein
MAEAAAGPAAAPATGSVAPLDDVMLAMDVVDQLRHADKLVERELATDDRDRQMKDRLRQVYAAQGISVPDRVLAEGVAALREGRFVYDPPKPGLSRSLALLWIRRGSWGKAVLIGLGVLAVVVAGYTFGVKRPQEQRIARQAQEIAVVLPERLASEFDRVKAVARDANAVASAETIVRQGLAAAKAGDLEGARRHAERLSALRSAIEQSYTLRIVSRPDTPSGTFRIPDANPNARNHYLIVEAIGEDGRPLEVTKTSEEDGRTAKTTMWGVRVSEPVFARVRADKQDDGVIQNNIVGEKRRGFLEPSYAMPVEGGVILSW